MLESLLIALTPTLALTPEAAPTPVVLVAQDVDADIKAAGDDVGALEKLAETYVAADESASAKLVWKRILELDAEHEAAHKGLRHHNFDGKWFESFAALSAYRRKVQKERLEKYGEVLYQGDWVKQTDVPYLRMGWEKEGDTWLRPGDKEKRAEEARLTAEGWEQQDLTWIHPDDFDKWRNGLWKIGEEWVSKDDANKYHSELDQWWEVPGTHYIALSTLDRDSVGWVVWYADKTYADLSRLFGLRPQSKPEFLTLNSPTQYGIFAAGDGAQRGGTEIDGFSSVHYAYFAESWFDASTPPGRYRGTGVCYWDVNNAEQKGFGQHAIRNAAAHAYMESIDPSWDAISRAIEGGGGQSTGPFWDEKRIPRWLRYGAASYCERYFQDREAQEGFSPWWAREWSLENLRRGGDVNELDAIFAMQLDVNDPAKSAKLMSEAGAIVAYILDGGNKALIDAHGAFKQAFRSGGDMTEPVANLEKAIRENERGFKRWAEL